MRGPHTGDPAEHLRADIDGCDARRQFAAQRESNADGRIKMGAGYRAERQNEHGQDRAGRKRVAQQRERAVTARELCRHDARADDAREQKGRSQALGNAPLRQRRHHLRPISFSFACRLS